MADDERVAYAVDRVSSLMDRILDVFLPGSKITVMVRRPGEPTQDFMLTSDTLPEIRALLERRAEAEIANRKGEARLLATTASPGSDA